MKKPTGRRPTGNVIRMTPKADDPERPSGTVLIDRVYHGKLGQFEDGDDERRIEDSFVLDCEEEEDPPGGDRPDATTALVGASFDAATTPDQRRRLRHNLAMCAIVHVPSTAWVTPVSLYFRCTFGARWLQQTRHGPNAGDRAFSTSSARARWPYRPANRSWASPPTWACFRSLALPPRPRSRIRFRKSNMGEGGKFRDVLPLLIVDGKHDSPFFSSIFHDGELHLDTGERKARLLLGF